MKNYINWKSFFILLGLSLVSVICVFPYIISLQGDVLKQIGQPIEFIFLAQLIQSLILFSIVIFLGLIFTKKIHFRLPLIEAILEKGDSKKVLKNILGISVTLGAITAIVIYAVDTLFTIQGAVLSTHQNYAPIWQKLLAAIYGGATEEILMRLFLMSFFIWLSVKLFKRQEATRAAIIVSIILAAVIFGLGHLPLTASLTNLTPLIIIRAVVLNGIGGIVFGWLFWKKGLESAMIAHFTADIFLLTLLPLVFK
ncbi:MAG: CPBP family intramembrane glutamic endopeptidase [Patescibacteria group bacterium]